MTQMPESPSPAPRRFLSKRVTQRLGLLAIACVYLWWGYARGSWNPLVVDAYMLRPNSFDGESSLLKATQIVPTLDTPVQRDKNVLWCASFPLAWKELQKSCAHGRPVEMEGVTSACSLLNCAPDPKADLPEGSSYAAAGEIGKGILDKITGDMADLFPHAPGPEFFTPSPTSVIAYSYLETSLKFKVPYDPAREPLSFSDSSGSTTPLRSFGIYGYSPIRDRLNEQAQLLYQLTDESYNLIEFAVDLSKDSQPNQLIFARVALKDTLASTVLTLEHNIESFTTQSRELEPNDKLIVPEFAWRIRHHFSELEHKKLLTPEFSGQTLDSVMQDIQFRLDRYGARLTSFMKVEVSCAPMDYVADGPFLLIMKRRDAKQPYFVLWVDNAELLQKWEK